MTAANTVETHQELASASAPVSSAVNLTGSYTAKVDSKGRVAIPAKFRKVLPTDLVVVRDPSGSCLNVFVKDDFDAWVLGLFQDKFGGYDSSSITHQRLRRKLNSSAYDVSADATGRISIPAATRKSVGIAQSIVIVGNSDRFEIWDAKTHDAEDEEVSLDVFCSD